MKIVIDIPEMAYEAFKEWHKNKVATVEQSLIANGTPYEERPKGEWTEHYDSSDGFTWLTCSRCMFKAYEDDYNFCPNCGAKMTKEAENETN